MTWFRHTRAGRCVMGLGILLAVALVAAGCSSGSSPNGSVAAPGGSTAPGGAGAAGVTVTAASGTLGAHLTDSAGKTLYLWVADTGTSSTCNGPCAAAWPPLTTKGAPQASGQAQAGMLGTTKRSDGKTQVTYDGHPLYYFAGDSGPGDTAGQGSNEFGAKWWMVAPAGTAITSGSSSGGSSGSTPAPSSGGYSY